LLHLDPTYFHNNFIINYLNQNHDSLDPLVTPTRWIITRVKAGTPVCPQFKKMTLVSNNSA
jgi:hypothetical protein